MNSAPSDPALNQTETCRPLFEAAALGSLTWAWETFGLRCCVLSSMQDTAVIELAMRVNPQFPVAFIDTGFHFPETKQTLQAVQDRYGITVEVFGPPSRPLSRIEPGQCCDSKVDLLEEALQNRDAWVSGIRRSQTEHRRSAAVIDRDQMGRTKVNPIIEWADSEHDRFVTDNDLVRNPLLAQGYTSIGCTVCTAATKEGDDPRAGRWPGTERVECGLHLPASGTNGSASGTNGSASTK